MFLLIQFQEGSINLVFWVTGGGSEEPGGPVEVRPNCCQVYRQFPQVQKPEPGGPVQVRLNCWTGVQTASTGAAASPTRCKGTVWPLSDLWRSRQVNWISDTLAWPQNICCVPCVFILPFFVVDLVWCGNICFTLIISSTLLWAFSVLQLIICVTSVNSDNI